MDTLRFASLTLILVGSAGLSGWAQASAASAATPCSAAQISATTLEQAENFVKAQLYDAAECSAQALVQANPTSADAHYLLGYVLNRRDKPNESLQEYTAGAQYQQPGPNDLAIIALDYVLLKDYADAEKWMSQASLAKPSNPLYV